MSTEQTVIEGALARLRNGEIEYQPRNPEGETLWRHWTRDPFYDGWDYDRIWEADGAAYAKDRGLTRFDADFDRESIGWSADQITKAKEWAADLIATKEIAQKFAPMREAAE